MDLLLEIIIWGAILWLASKFILFYLQAKNEILKEEHTATVGLMIDSIRLNIKE